MDDHPGYRSEVEEQGFHFIHCKRQPQDECHRVQREDIRLVGPDGTVSENQNVEHLVDGTPVVAKYPGRLYDKDEFYPAVVVRSKFNVSLVFFFVFFYFIFLFCSACVFGSIILHFLVALPLCLSPGLFDVQLLFTAMQLVVLHACFVVVGVGAGEEAHLYCAVRSRTADRDRLLV